MNTIERKRRIGTMPHDAGGERLEDGHIPGRPVLDPMNHLDAEAERKAETGTENPYFGESDPGRLPHLQHTMHVAKTRRWVIASTVLWLVAMVLGFTLISMSEALAAGALAVSILLYGMVWIFRMFLATDHRRTMLPASLAGLPALLVIALALLLVAG